MNGCEVMLSSIRQTRRRRSLLAAGIRTRKLKSRENGDV
jgi:hypothetical protein